MKFDYNFVGTVSEDNSDKEDEIEIGIVSDSHSHGRPAICRL